VTSVNFNPGAPNKNINYWNNNLNPGIGLSVLRNFSPAVGLEINWLNTRLTGKWNDNWPPLPISVGRETPLTYNSQINQFDLMIGINLNQIMLPGDNEDVWHLFIKTGAGIADIHDNKKFYPGINYVRLSFPLDLGLSVSISKRMKFQIGSTLRFVNTDNLDGVHVTYTNLNGDTVTPTHILEIYNYTYLKYLEN